jgi:hypothetical protein
LPKTLGEIAVDAGLVSKTDATRAGKIADTQAQPLIAVLIREIGVDEVALVAAIRRQTRVPLLDPADARPDPDAIRLIPREACKRLRVLPLAVASDPSGNRVLRVAMADPTDTAAIAEIDQIAGCEIEITALPLSAVEELVDRGYQGFTTAVVRSPKRRFGDSMRMHAAGTGQVREETGEIPLTVPFHAVTDEADADLRFQALYSLLLSKGVITEDEYEETLRDLLKRVAGEPGSDD